MILTTLCYLIKDGQVLLAKKKRGFGVGKINGPGGKVKPGESHEQACRREVQEEVGIDCCNLEGRGYVEFEFKDKPEWNQRCYIFTAHQYKGEPCESQEMLPLWYPLDTLPYENMWEDDPIWLPRVLLDETIFMKFYFDSTGKMLGHKHLKPQP